MKELELTGQRNHTAYMNLQSKQGGAFSSNL